MYLEENQAMNLCTKLHSYISARPKLKQWLWFISLWFGGLAVVSSVAYLIKFMMYFHL